MPTLLFKNGRGVNGKNYKTLYKIHLRQMEISATRGFGAEYITAEHFLEQCRDGDMNDAVVELWDVVDADNPSVVVYDCWVYLADTATVFFAGTAEDTLAGMCQWSFDDHSEDKSNKELCQDLQEAFDSKKDR